MRCARAITLLAILACGVQRLYGAEATTSEYSCRDTADTAKGYLAAHGLLAVESGGFRVLSLVGTLRKGHLRNNATPWTDADGREVNDRRVYWTYADRKTGERVLPPVWRLRLEHYEPTGEITLMADGGGCTLRFQIHFQAWGANVLLIMPVDSMWQYGSNGRLERGYLDGILDLQRQGHSPSSASRGK